MSSHRQTKDLGAAVAGLGATLLLISLFLDWYEPGRSAWSVFETWDLVLAGLALWAITAAVRSLGLAGRGRDASLVVPSVGSAVIVVASLLNHPPAAAGHAPMAGIWLALSASIIMAIGTWLSLARVSLAIDVEDSGLRRPARTEPTRVAQPNAGRPSRT